MADDYDDYSECPVKNKTIKTCYYELLDVEEDANDDELKRAFRLQALKWHPDKNPSDPGFAAQRFREIQAAYEVLSDARKRAWYNKFKNRILKGDEDIVDDKCLDVTEFMSSQCYDGYTDEEGSFYAVYRNVFDEIIREELPYQEEDDAVPPGFGNRSSSYEDVKNFYIHWSTFNTKKHFDHLVKYDVLDAPNRRVLRLMEKDNNKIREAARRQRNELVRSLVAFVKKKDKRLAEKKKEIECKRVENRKKTEENRRRQLQERQSQLQSDQALQADWSSMNQLQKSLDELEKRLDQEEGRSKNTEERDDGDDSGCNQATEQSQIVEILPDSDDEDDDQPVEALLCVACDKRFKSIKALENHGRSKKHKDNLNRLKRALEDDDLILDH